MPVPFGFGGGDFFAFAIFVKHLTTALNGSHGASADYRAFQDGLQSLKRSLDTITGLIMNDDILEDFNAGPTSLGPQNRASLNGLGYEIQSCKDILETFAERSGKFDILLKRPSTRRLQIVKATLSWSMDKDRMISETQRALNSHLDAMKIYIDAIML